MGFDEYYLSVLFTHQKLTKDYGRGYAYSKFKLDVYVACMASFLYFVQGRWCTQSLCAIVAGMKY